MKYYPVCLDIKGRNCVIIGGGRVAERKVNGVLACHGLVTVISPDLTEKLQNLAADGTISWKKRPYQHGDIQGAFMVIAATDDPKAQDEVFSEAEKYNILLNVADVPKKCNFILPALAKRGDLTIAISTAGKSPALAKKMRRELQKSYGGEYESLVEIMGLIRPIILAKDLSQKENEAIFNRILASDITTRIIARDEQGIKNILADICEEKFDNDTITKIGAALKGIAPEYIRSMKQA